MKYDDFETGELMFNAKSGMTYMKTDVYPYILDLRTGEITWIHDLEELDFHRAHIYTIHRK